MHKLRYHLHHHAHVVVHGSVSFGAFVTLALHAVSPTAEAVAFFVTSLLAVWASDVERHLRHPKLAR